MTLRTTIVSALCVAAVSLAPASALSQSGKKKGEDTAEVSASAQAIVAGHEAMLRKEYDAAVRQYLKAKESASGNPEVYYYLASARMAKGDYDQALSDFRTAIEIAGTKRVDIHAKCLFSMAVLEESRQKWDAAKSAWQDYVSFANSHKDVPVFIENAEARIKALDARAELDKSYEPVRKRIADREAKKAGKSATKKVIVPGY